MNIAHGNSLVFKAVTIFFLAAETKIKDHRDAARKLNYEVTHTKKIMTNWINNGIYKEGVFFIEEYNSDLELITQLTLLGLVGAGKLSIIEIIGNNNQPK